MRQNSKIKQLTNRFQYLDSIRFFISKTRNDFCITVISLLSKNRYKFKSPFLNI